MAGVSFEVQVNPPQEVVDVIGDGLGAYNDSFTGKREWEKMAIVVKDDEGKVLGGLTGAFGWDWLHVTMLWLDQGLRGQDVGTKLIAMAEQEALARGITSIHLETTSFQALGFYLKNGFEIVGRLKDKPKGHTWYYLKKEDIDKRRPAGQ
ncbi:MAG: GNAT family N-acetyltransferase [Anaerolineae bacterium]